MSNAIRKHLRAVKRNARIYSTKEDFDNARNREAKQREAKLDAYRRWKQSTRQTSRTLAVAK